MGHLPLGQDLVEQDGHGGEGHPRLGAEVQLRDEAVAWKVSNSPNSDLIGKLKSKFGLNYEKGG